MRYTYSLISILFLAFAFDASSQVMHPFRGVVADSLRTPLAGATIRVFLQGGDSLSVISGKNGGFQISEVHAGDFTLHISLVGYRTAERRIQRGFLRGEVADTIFLSRDYHSLDTVIVTSLAPVVLKGDTIEYRAGAYTMQPGDLVEDLVKRFPGVSVDMKGQITAQGKQIVRIKVNGKDFFGDDMLIATQNLPADIVKNIQVIQDYGEESRLTGIKSGQPVTILNINTRDDKKRGKFGQATAGTGTGGVYLGNAFANKFDNDQRIAISGGGNNVNTGGAGGINNQQSVSAQYSDRWTAKLSGNVIDNFGHSTGSTTSKSIQQSIFPNGSTLNNSTSASSSRSVSNNGQFSMEYNPEGANTVTVHSMYLYANSRTSSNNDFSILQTDSLNQKLSAGNSKIIGNSQSSTIGTDLLYVHHFKNIGRMITFSTSLNDNHSMQENDNLNNTGVSADGAAAVWIPLRQHTDNDNHINNTSLKFTYIEPVNKRTNLLVNYDFTSNRNKSNRNTYNIDSVSGTYSLVDSLSDQYSFSQTTHQVGIGLNGNIRRIDYNFLLSVQPILVNGNSLTQKFVAHYYQFALIPSFSLNYKLKKTMNLNVNYGASTGMPDFMQLRPSTDLSNPQYPVTGNPDLKPSYAHNLSIGVTLIKPEGDFFSVNANGMETQNSIVTNVINNPQGATGGGGAVIQETRYLNTNGVYSANGSYNYSKPFLQRKLVLSTTGGIGYNNNISFINNIRTINANLVWSQGMQFTTSIPKLMDLSLQANYSSSKTEYHSDSSINTTVNSLVMGLNGRNYFLRRFVLAYDLTHTFNKGYSASVANNPTMINVSLERWLVKDKKASVKLQCYNLLNQQTLIGRAVAGNSITDSQVNRIGRYYMLTLNVRLNEFSGRR